MDAMIPHSGHKLILDWAFSQTGEDLFLRLYTNDVIPSPTTITADLKQANFNGYVPITLLRANWSLGAINTQGDAEILYSKAQKFTAAAGVKQIIYGHFITSPTGQLLAIKPFPKPIELRDADFIELQPSLSISKAK